MVFLATVSLRAALSTVICFVSLCQDFVNELDLVWTGG